jgi:hypothetical protein
MPAAAPGSIGEVPYLDAEVLPGRVGGRLGPVAQAELGQQVSDVVLDGLAGDVQPLGDLGVGQPGPDQLQDLGLAPGQGADPLGAGPDRGPERPQQGPAASACRATSSRSKSSRAALASATATSGVRPARARAISSRVLASSIGSWAREKPSRASCRQARASPCPLATQIRPLASAAAALR